MKSLFCRFTPESKTTLEEVYDILYGIYDKFIVSIEEATRVHFHFIVYTESSIQSTRYVLKKNLEGQIYISGREVISQIQAVAYTIKDGQYKQHNMDVNTLLMAKVIAKPKIVYDKEIKTINDKYDGVDDYSYIKDIIELYGRFNKSTHPVHIRAMLRTQKAKKNDVYRERLIKEIIEFI